MNPILQKKVERAVRLIQSVKNVYAARYSLNPTPNGMKARTDSLRTKKAFTNASWKIIFLSNYKNIIL